MRDIYDELIKSDMLDVLTECERTQSCAACSRRSGCERIDRSEKAKRYFCLISSNKKITLPPEIILKYVHTSTRGRGFAKDEVVEIADGCTKYVVSEDIDKLKAVAMELILPDECLQY